MIYYIFVLIYTRLHLFDQRSSNTMKYYYNFKELFCLKYNLPCGGKAEFSAVITPVMWSSYFLFLAMLKTENSIFFFKYLTCLTVHKLIGR